MWATVLSKPSLFVYLILGFTVVLILRIDVFQPFWRFLNYFPNTHCFFLSNILNNFQSSKFFFFFLMVLSLNSGPWAYEAGALPLESLCQPHNLYFWSLIISLVVYDLLFKTVQWIASFIFFLLIYFFQIDLVPCLYFKMSLWLGIHVKYHYYLHSFS
jgi:hypothetical protein